MNLFHASNAKKMNSFTNIKWSEELFIPGANFSNIDNSILINSCIISDIPTT